MINLKKFLTAGGINLFVKSILYGVATGALNLLIIIIITHANNIISPYGYLAYMVIFFFL